MEAQMQELAPQNQELILKPITIPNVLLITAGRWNDIDYSELEIQKAFNSTDWNDRKFTSLYLDHQDTKERGVGNWVGYIKNKKILGSSIYGDLEIWNPMIGAFLSQAKAKFGISATLAGRENKREGRMEDFHFESFSIVTDPACKPAMINLSDKTVNLVEGQNIQVVTMENEVKENIVELESVKHRERRENSESVLDKKDFDSALKAMLVDEKNAPSQYENLKSLCEDEDVKKMIDGIIADEHRHYSLLENIKAKKELANQGSQTEIHALEPVKVEKDEELGAKFERQVSHIMDSLRKSHPDWSEEKIKSVAYATANKMKENTQLSSEQVQAWIDTVVLAEKSDSNVSSRTENSENLQMKGGNKMPEIENESAKVALEAKPVEAKAEIKEELKKEEPKSEDKKSEKEDEEKEEELSSDAILNKVKEMSADELVKYSNFVKAYLSEHKDASASEVTLAYEKSLADKKELSATELLASIEARNASLKELENKEIAKLQEQVKELQAKVKVPDRKTLSVAFNDASSTDANLGMLSFLQHRIN